MRFYFYLITIVLLISCSDSGTNSSNHYGLPTEFPLKVGNAWVYQTTYFNPDQNRYGIDTLYIIGRYGDSYQMSLHQSYGYEIVENDQNKLIVLGLVLKENDQADPDTTIYDKPFIRTFFNIDTGFIAKSEFEDYDCFTDSVHISVEYGMEFINNIYDVYIVKFYRRNSPYVWYEHVISVDGLMRERYFSLDDLMSEMVIQDKLQNVDYSTN